MQYETEDERRMANAKAGALEIEKYVGEGTKGEQGILIAVLYQAEIMADVSTRLAELHKLIAGEPPQ